MNRRTLLIALLFTLFVVQVVFAQTVHIVRQDENLYRIGLQYGLPFTAIAQHNNIINPNQIKEGQQLTIPDGGTAVPIATFPADTEMREHIIAYGETLSSIALFYDVPAECIVDANGIVNPNLIYAGQKLLIPMLHPDNSPTVNTPIVDDTAVFNWDLGGQTASFSHPDLMRSSGMTWVKFSHEWQETDAPDILKDRINNAHGQGFKVLLTIAGQRQDNINFGAYTDFLAGVAGLGPEAIEVWQGQNSEKNWLTGNVDASMYVNEMLKPAYEKIKGTNGNVMVISGAPTNTADYGETCNAQACDGKQYMREMFDNGAVQYTDCIGIQYLQGTVSPWEQTGDGRDNGHNAYYYRKMVDTYLDASQNAKPLCFTALGYLSAEGLGTLDNSSFAWAAGTSRQNQTDWLGQAVHIAKNVDQKVDMLIIYNVDATIFDPTQNIDAGYAIIRNGNCPACNHIRQAARIDQP